jgi:short-subunit dehydrogenase
MISIMNNTHAISHLFSLHGKTALVTGCKRGIGRAMAVGLAEAGADIIGVSATLEPTGSAVEKEVTALGRSFTSYACDFSDRSALKEFIDKVQKSHPVIDILINNAGTILRKPAAEHPDEYWDAIIETNLSAQFLLARELGQKMIERGCGKWRDFLGLGISGAVLFHTHLFSAMALTFAALAASPAILCKSGAWLKATIAGGVAMALVVPWLIFSGFFDTASTVPKVYRLFESADDILAYMLDRPLPLVLVGGLVMALLIARLFPKSLPGGLAPILQSHAGIYIVLICWMASAYLAFHTIIPAASFFYERLSLVLWTPFVLVVAVLISDLLRKGAASWTPVLRGIPARMVKDVWMGFFLRFVDPGSRIGQNLNILSRLQKASIQYVPEARLVIYTSPGCKPVQDQN